MENVDKSEAKPDTNDNSYLDSILDDALEDFNKPVAPKKGEDTSTNTSITDSNVPNTNAWTDEFINTATQNFEVTMKALMDQQKEVQTSTGQTATETDTSENALDVGAMSTEFAKFAEAAAKAATDASSDKDFTHFLADTMQQIAKNKEEAQVAPSADDLAKMFEGFGLGDTNNAGDENDLSGLFPLMQTMLENILSKDILYPPLKEIVSKYPDWLADNRSSLSETDFDRYNKQYDIMKQVVEAFEKESKQDSEEVKAQNSENILILMQKLQELGQPPRELMSDYEPILNMDSQGNPQLPDLSALLGSVGFPSFGSNLGPSMGAEPTTSTSATSSLLNPAGLSLGTSQQGNPGPPPDDGSDQCAVM